VTAPLTRGSEFPFDELAEAHDGMPDDVGSHTLVVFILWICFFGASDLHQPRFSS
jgi:hypothetical protein